MTAADLYYWYNCSSCISKWIWREGKIMHILTYFKIVCNCMDIPFLFFTPILWPSEWGSLSFWMWSFVKHHRWSQGCDSKWLCSAVRVCNPLNMWKYSALALQKCTWVMLLLLHLGNLELLSETFPCHRTTSSFLITTTLGFCAHFFFKDFKAQSTNQWSLVIILCCCARFSARLQNTDGVSHWCESEPKKEHSSVVRFPSLSPATGLVIEGLTEPGEVVEFLQWN